jgi:hypothetical protein
LIDGNNHRSDSISVGLGLGLGRRKKKRSSDRKGSQKFKTIQNKFSCWMNDIINVM